LLCILAIVCDARRSDPRVPIFSRCLASGYPSLPCHIPPRDMVCNAITATIASSVLSDWSRGRALSERPCVGGWGLVAARPGPGAAADVAPRLTALRRAKDQPRTMRNGR
jgi:hypothetical protein